MATAHWHLKTAGGHCASARRALQARHRRGHSWSCASRACCTASCASVADFRRHRHLKTAPVRRPPCPTLPPGLSRPTPCMMSHPEAMVVPSAPAAPTTAAAAAPTNEDDETNALRAQVAELAAALAAAKAQLAKPAAPAAGTDAESTTASVPPPPTRDACTGKSVASAPPPPTRDAGTGKSVASALPPPTRKPGAEESAFSCVLSCFNCSC